MTSIKESLRSALILLALFVSASASLGHLTRMEGIKALGLRSTFAPFVTVLNQEGGYEYWNGQYSLKLFFEDGSQIKIPLDNDNYKRSGQIHNTRMAYFIMLTFFPITDIFKISAHKIICSQKVLLRNFGINKKPKRWEVYGHVKKYHHWENWNRSFSCSKK